MTSPSGQLFDNILVVHLGPLGNWILATGAFRDLRETFPQSRIVLLTADGLSALAARTGCFDEILSAPWRPPWREYVTRPASLAQGIFFRPYWMRKLRPYDFGLAVDLHGSPSLHGLISRLAKIALPFRGLPGTHMVEKYRSSIDVLGVPARHEPSLPPAAVRRRGLEGVDYAVLIPRSKRSANRKNWNPARFVDIGRRLQRSGLCPIVVGPSEHGRPLKALASEPGFVSLVGETSLDDLIELFSFATIVVGVDTGTLHLASAVGAPTLGLYGPTRMHAWQLRGRRVGAVKKATMMEIAVDEVWAACQALVPSLSC